MNIRKSLTVIIIFIFFITGMVLASSSAEKSNELKKDIILTITGLETEKTFDMTLNKIIYQKIFNIKNGHIIVANKDDLKTIIQSTTLYHFNVEFKKNEDNIDLKAQLFDENHKKLLKGLSKKDIPIERLIDYTDKALTILIRELNEAN